MKNKIINYIADGLLFIYYVCCLSFMFFMSFVLKVYPAEDNKPDNKYELLNMIVMDKNRAEIFIICLIMLLPFFRLVILKRFKSIPLNIVVIIPIVMLLWLYYLQYLF